MGALGNKKRMGAKSVDMSGIFQKDDSMSSKKSSSSSSRDANSIPAFFKNFKLQKDKGTIPSSAFSPSSSSLPSSSASGQSGKQLLRSVKSKKADLEAKAPAKVAEYDEDDEVGPEFETYASKLKFRKVWQPKKNRPSRAISKEQRACVVPDMMTLRDLSRWTKYSMSKLNDVMVEQLGMRKIDACEYLDASTAELIGLELDIDVQIASKISKIDRLPTVIPEDRSSLKPKPPIVCIMGHVNHGKTSLLDALRKTNVVESEAGGITQGLGGFLVKSNGAELCFLDTPGHSVFHAMRSRGCQATDIAVIVVSATDGVQEQTVESIRIAQDQELPIIIAINKCDVDGADVDGTKGQLMDAGVVVEDLGGETISVDISAKTGTGLDDLIDAIQVQAEMEELRADHKAAGEFMVIESKFQRGKGLQLNSIVRWGSIKVGDFFVCGKEYGRIKEILDCQGKRLKKAGPSTPVAISGLRGEESYGDEGLCVKNEKEAKKIIEYRKDKEAYESIWSVRAKEAEAHVKLRAAASASDKKSSSQRRRSRPTSPTHDVTVADIDGADGDDGNETLHIILRGDCQGSLEAIGDYLQLLPDHQVRAKLVKSAVGPPTITDLAAAEMLSNACLVLFNVKAGASIVKEAERLKLPLTAHDVIYNLFDDVRDKLSAMLPTVEKTKVLGSAEFLQPLKLSSGGRKTVTAAGVRVRNGTLVRKAKWRVLRDDEEIFTTDEAESMRHFKDSVESMPKGEECGVLLNGFEDFKPGDVLQSYEFVMEPSKLDDSAARRQQQYYDGK